MKKNLSMFLVVLLVISLLAGCGSPAGSSDGTDGNVGEGKNKFVYAMGTEPISMDPHMITDTNSASIQRQMYESLVTWDENKNVAPELAESWSVSDDGLEWTFKLRQDVVFHDGSSFDADVAVYSLERLRDPATGSPRAINISSFDEIRAEDPYTLVIKTHEPNGALLATITGYNLKMMHPDSSDKDNFVPNGTGPLKFVEWARGEYLTMTKNENYWGEKSTVDELKCIWVPEIATRMMLVQTGEADIVSGLSPMHVPTIANQADTDAIVQQGCRAIYIGLNLERPIFEDIKVRQALRYAVDRQGIIDNILSGIGTLPVGVVPTSVAYAATDLPDKWDYNPEKAKEILAEAGYGDGFGRKLTFISPEGRYPMDRQVAEAVQGMFSDIGIDAEIKILDFAVLTDVLKSGDFDIFLLSNGYPTGDIDWTFASGFLAGGGNNFSKFSDPRIDELIRLQRSAINEADREKYALEAQTILNFDSHYNVLYYESQIFGIRNDVQGFVAWPTDMLDMQYLTRK